MSDDKQAVLNEARYAERLCLRTARLYRRLQTFGIFLSIVAGSATLSSLSSHVPASVPVLGAVLFVVFGAAMLAIRPADKATANEADAKRYAKVRTEGTSLDGPALRAALERARESDVPEVEALRDVAFNDVVREIGCADAVVPLGLTQRALSAIA